MAVWNIVVAPAYAPCPYKLKQVILYVALQMNVVNYYDKFDWFIDWLKNIFPFVGIVLFNYRFHFVYVHITAHWNKNAFEMIIMFFHERL